MTDSCLGVVVADTGLVTPKAPVAGFPNRPEEAGESGGLANILLGVAGAGEKMEAGASVLAAEEKMATTTRFSQMAPATRGSGKTD